MTFQRDPITTKRQPAFVGDHILSVPVSRDVADVINAVAAKTHDELVHALAPFGLHPYDVLVPEFRRVVYRDEIADSGGGEAS